MVGFDISDGMVETSGRRAEKEGLTDRVEFRVADAQDLPFKVVVSPKQQGNGKN